MKSQGFINVVYSFLMAYKYNISYIEEKEMKKINFRSKKSMINYLNQNKAELNLLKSVKVNFDQIHLPLSSTIWKKS